ncbi:hypothetical protein G7Y89_g2454 [Cudoniella acicularis]|uniref:Uncharacterized protein n=1 Tax=Cudoniella acicularis TaxID=354080 RepID=A0A8H4W6Y8_9HELO|nr:hypothetical protein G7Y89_g2454 [Cudoniella acicularis]
MAYCNIDFYEEQVKQFNKRTFLHAKPVQKRSKMYRVLAILFPCFSRNPKPQTTPKNSVHLPQKSITPRASHESKVTEPNNSAAPNPQRATRKFLYFGPDGPDFSQRPDPISGQQSQSGGQKPVNAIIGTMMPARDDCGYLNTGINSSVYAPMGYSYLTYGGSLQYDYTGTQSYANGEDKRDVAGILRRNSINVGRYTTDEDAIIRVIDEAITREDEGFYYIYVGHVKTINAIDSGRIIAKYLLETDEYSGVLEEYYDRFKHNTIIRYAYIGTPIRTKNHFIKYELVNEGGTEPYRRYITGKRFETASGGSQLAQLVLELGPPQLDKVGQGIVVDESLL